MGRYRQSFSAAVLITLLVGSLLAAATVSSSSNANAGVADNFSLAKSDNVGGRALIGEEVTYTITAAGDHSSGAYLYNLSFRDVLQVGVEFVSASPPPTEVLVDVPAPGQTTVIWSNVSDLPANSQAAVDITVDTNPDFAGGASGSGTVPVGSSISNDAESVASLNAFLVPDYDVATGAFTADFDGSASASHSVEIIPFRVTKAGNGELLRGVHQNGIDAGGGTIGDLWTIEIENNPDYAVNGLTLVDTLDPELEFLGCSDYYAADNTTVGEEWTGSGDVATGTGCSAPIFTPTSVDTGATGETIVNWEIGNLAPGQVEIVTYQAGFPLFANEPFDGAAPAPASLGQGRNLDNNTGGSTGEPDRTVNADPELLTAPETTGENTAAATGTYTPTGALGSDFDTFSSEAEDLVISKSMSGSLNHGEVVTTTLTITTSEYRDFSNLVVRDLLPSGLCFLGTFNVDNSGGSDWATNDCPGAGSIQSTINGAAVDVAQVRELPDGGPYGTGRFELVWDFADADNAVLADLDSDGTHTITYSAVVRQYYRGGLVSLLGEPVLAGDSVTNEAEVSGPDVVANATLLAADPVDPDGGIDGDTTSASIDNQVANINKRISVKAGPLDNGAGTTGATCATDYASITWSEADPGPELGFGPGDIVCFELNAGFPANVNYEGTAIQDLLPPGYSYIPGSAARIASGDTLPGTTVTESANVVSFTLGGSGDVDNTGNTFQWVIAADITDNALGAALDINANLEKLIHNNNGGLVFQLRDQTPAEWTEPQIRIAKGVGAVNTVPTAGPDSDGSLGGGSTATVVNGSDEVSYRLDIWNTGNTDALATEVQDVIPSDFTCAEVDNVSDGGICAAGVITWSGLTVAASTGGGDTTPDDETTAPITLTYDLTVPDTVDPGHVYTNESGVATYQGMTNTGPYDYYPENNIDPANASAENTDEARDPGYIQIAAPTIDVVQQSGIADAGNAANASPDPAAEQATIGEIVRYDVTVTIPQGTSVYDAEITSAIPAGMSWFTGLGLIDEAVTDLQPTVTSPTGTAALTTGTIGEGAGVVSYGLPNSYTNVGGTGDDQVTITFYAIVGDVPANAAATPTVFTNSGTFDWLDAAAGDPAPVVSNDVTTEVVEPNPSITKIHTIPAGTEVSSGDLTTYLLSVTNDSSSGNVSVAHDLEIVDTIPAGVTPLDGGGFPVTTDGDLVPSVGITPAGAFTGNWSETNHTITWTPADWIDLDSLDPDGTLTFSFDAEVDDPAVSSGVLTNVADLTAYSLDQDLAPDADPNADLARTYRVSDDDTLTLPLASLSKDIEPFNSIDPTDDIATFTIGEPVDYQLSVVVPNRTVIYDATQFDSMPAGLDFDSFGAVTVGTECEIFDAISGASTGVSLTPADVEQFNPVGADTQLAAWFIGDVYAAGDCAITLEYTAHVNSTVVDTDAVANSSQLTWNVTSQVASESPAALEPGYDSPGSASWNNDAGPEAEPFTVVEPLIEIDQDVTDVSGTPLANPDCDTTPGNNNGGSDDPDGLAANGCDTMAGSQVRYTATVTNVGTTDAHDVTVVETVPAGVTPLDGPGGVPVTTTGQTITGSTGSVGVWDETDHTITWLIPGPIAVAGTSTLDYDAVVDASNELTRGQDITTTADVPAYFGLAEADRTAIVLANPANDDIITYGNDAAATRGPVTPDVNTIEVHFPELTVAKAPASGQDRTDVRLDSPFTWEITIESTDPVASAFTIDASDVLPEGWTYDVGSAVVTTPYNGGPIAVEPTCAASAGACGDTAALNIETLGWDDLITGATEPLAAGQQIVISFSATPQSAALTSTRAIGEAHTGYSSGSGFAHVNDVSVLGEDSTGSTSCCDPDGPGGVDPASYGAAALDDVFIARADIEVDKTISPLETDGDPNNGPYWFGSWVNYTVTANNVGPDAATGVQLSDVLDPAALAFDSVVLIDHGTFDDSTNIWDVGSIPSGASYQLTLRTRLVGLGQVTNTAQNAATDQYDSDSSPGNDIASEDDHDTVTIEVVPTSLGDFVWLDLNDDGVQDAGEPGIPGVGIELSWTDPGTGLPVVFTTTTGTDGSYGIPPAAGLPTNTDITVTIDTASAGLIGLTPSFDRDGTLDNTATEQVTNADTALPGGALADLAFDFGYTADGTQSFGDKVWWDQDNSGDASNGVGEVPLAAIDVNALWAGWDGVFGTADDLVFAETTNATGDYLFTDMPPGDFEVSVDSADLPLGLDIETYDLDGIATASLVELTLDPGENQLDVDFSYTGPGAIGDTVWFDHDQDGVIEHGEPGLGGVTVTALWDGPDGAPGGDDITLTTVTDPDGTYSFDNLPYGQYVVTVDTSPLSLPTGLTQTFDSDGTLSANSSTVSLDAVTPTNADQDFGYVGAGSIGDTVFFDVDGTETDGVLDSGDAPIVGVDVTVVWAGADATLGTADDFTFTTTTGAAGDYVVTDLPHGTFSVTVDDTGLPAGLTTPTFDADTPATAHTSTTTLDTATPEDLNQDFAYTGTGAGVVGDIIFFDQNNNGLEDPGEIGFSGVAVTLVWFGPDGVVGGGDDVPQTTVTDPDGVYLFDNLPDGNYSVNIDPSTLPLGLTPTADADGIATPDTSLVAISPTTQFNLDQDFGYTGVGSLGNLVWLDVDNSGTATPDAGEPGIAGVDLSILWTNPQGVDVTYSVTTMADGAYLVPNLPFGSYSVAVVPASLPGGVSPTFDVDGIATPDVSTAILDATQPDDLDQDFSYAGVGSIGDTIWFDQDADAAIDPVGSGVFDNQDQPLAGVDVTVTWGGFDGVVGDYTGTVGVDESADDLEYTTTTDAAGEWLVPGLPHGNYEVVVDSATLPAGLAVATFDADGIGTADTSSIALDSAAPDNLDQDFSYTGAGSIGDTVWFDHNGDGVVDPEEVPLAGVTVTLEYDGPDGTPITETAVTDLDGSYLFENLPFDVPLTIRIDDLTLPAGFVPVSDSDGVATPHVAVTTLTDAAPANLDQNFGYNGSGQIGNRIWLDRDASGSASVDPGDVGMRNIDTEVVWTNPTGAADFTFTASTSVHGLYNVYSLPFGSYTVTVDTATLPLGVTPTFDADGVATPHTSSVVIDATTPVNRDQDFSYTGSGALGDTIWTDFNADGVIDVGEVPLEGVLVTLTYRDLVSNLPFTETATTGLDGTYSFSSLPGGSYTMTIDPTTLPDGYAPTFDLDGIGSAHVARVLLADSEINNLVDFGYRPEADLTLAKTHVGDLVAGAQNSWTLTAGNAGPATASAPVVITDTLPANTTFVSSVGAEWDCGAAASLVTCTYIDSTGSPADLLSGASSTVELSIIVDAAAAPGVTNTASVDSATADPLPADNTDSDSANAPLSVLSVTNTLRGDLEAGEDAVYELVVTNHGPDATRGDSVVTFELPVGMTFDDANSSLSAAGCSVSGQTVTCTNPGVLASGESWTIEVTVDVSPAVALTTLTTVASVSGGNLVNGSQLPSSTLDDVYSALKDPSSGLRAALGIGDGAIVNGSAAASAVVAGPPPSGPLALTGRTAFGLLGLALVLIVAGAYAMWLSRHSRRRAESCVGER